MQHRPRKRFSQNFLHQPDIIRRIITTFGPAKNDVVVEIGPGQGALTMQLADKVSQLHLIELDRDLVSRLSEEFSDRPHVHIHSMDALKLKLDQLATGQSLRIIGNLPYNISTPLLFHLLDQREYISDCLFMLQKEVVDRIVASPNCKDYGRLSVMCQLYCETSKCFNVAPGAFTPPPKVDSAIVKLVPRLSPIAPLSDKKCFAEIVQLSFAQRRKTLRNSLKTKASPAAFEIAGIDPQRRPENLSLEEFIALTNAVVTNPAQ